MNHLLIKLSNHL